jgi:hypothetical protein
MMKKLVGAFVGAAVAVNAVNYSIGALSVPKDTEYLGVVNLGPVGVYKYKLANGDVCLKTLLTEHPCFSVVQQRKHGMNLNRFTF